MQVGKNKPTTKMLAAAVGPEGTQIPYYEEIVH